MPKADIGLPVCVAGPNMETLREDRCGGPMSTAVTSTLVTGSAVTTSYQAGVRDPFNSVENAFFERVRRWRKTTVRPNGTGRDPVSGARRDTE